MIETYSHEWGIEKIFTITVDNTTLMIQLSLILWGMSLVGVVMNLLLLLFLIYGRYLRLRCCVHIINSIVYEGLRETHDSIVCISNAIKYVNSSPTTYENWKEWFSSPQFSHSFPSIFIISQTKVLHKARENRLKFHCASRCYNYVGFYLFDVEMTSKFDKNLERLEEEDTQSLNYFGETMKSYAFFKFRLEKWFHIYQIS